MLTRFVRIQLTIFTIASIVGVLVMIFVYVQVPTLLGIGRITVTLELPSTGGLYRFSNVTYRGAQIGRVTEVDLTDTGAKATLSLDTSPKIPADLQADVRSISAVGEQYVELSPRTKSGPYLHDGSVIALRDTTVPQGVGPMLDQVSAMVKSIPKDKLYGLVDESAKAFNGAGYDLGSLSDSSAKLSGELNGIADRAQNLFADAAPLLDSQVDSADALRTWAHSLAGVTDQLVTNDRQVRTLLEKGPGAADEASRLLTQLKPTLPILLANLTTVGQLLVTYRPALEQMLVLVPPFVAGIQTSSPINNPTGQPMGDFALTTGDPPACTVGFLPPNQWRNPADTTEVDTPDGLYCKLPQDSPISVRGARNYPCLTHPGKRAPTAEICNSDQEFEPLAMRQHALGSYPIDPNLISQGVPPDSRVDADDNIFAPAEGTPLPPGQTSPVPPPGPLLPGPPPQDAPPPTETPVDGAPAAPSAFKTDGSAPHSPITVAEYVPQTGRYLGSDGHVYQQSNLADAGTPRSWKDLVLAAHT